MIQDMNGEDVIKICKKCGYRMSAIWNLDCTIIDGWFCNSCYRREIRVTDGIW